MTPQITTIVPIYKVEKYLEKCLDSIVNQTFKDIEIILIDDCGNDNSINIAKDYAKKDNRIKIVQNEQNRGQGYARNLGVNLAKAPYISFVDADDWLEPNAYEILYKKLTKHNSDFTLCGFKFIYPNQQTQDYSMDKFCNDYERTYTCDDNPIEILGALITVVWNGLYNKDFLIQNNIFFDETKKGEDRVFCWKCKLASKNITFIPDILYNYNKCNEQQDTKFFSTITNAFNITINEIKPLIIDKPQYHNAFILDAYFHFKSIKTRSESILTTIKYKKLYLEKALANLNLTNINELQDYMPIYPINDFLEKNKFSYFNEIKNRLKIFKDCLL